MRISYLAKRIVFYGLMALVYLLKIGDALACPNVADLPDINCDGKAVIVVIGDSLVAGIGDTVNNGSGGYVLRAQEKYPLASFYSYGVPGLRTTPLISRIKKAFANSTSSELAQNLLTADLVVLDLGRNDRWDFGLPEATLRYFLFYPISFKASLEDKTLDDLTLFSSNLLSLLPSFSSDSSLCRDPISPPYAPAPSLIRFCFNFCSYCNCDFI